MGSGILDRLVVVFTLSLICFISYSSQIFIIWPWYGRVLSVELVNLLLPFNFLVGMLLWNYRLCVLTDPGRVPHDWNPDFDSKDGYEVKKLTGGPRFCRTCEQYKPPRAHHCRQCNRCVLRMDHHCPWINNCVGHFNYGHFIRFLFYVDVACSYHLTMVTRRVLDAMRGHFWDQPSTTEFVFIILNYVTCVPVLLTVGAFSIYHFYSMSGNSTTIEAREKDKAATLVRRGKLSEIKFPYNLGIRRNIESVLGNNPLLWCCPNATPGSGLRFQVVQGDDVSESWPPRDDTINSSNEHSTFVLPSSPWTYEDGSFNPNLRPNNGHMRSSQSRRRNSTKTADATLPVPPYHPDYHRYTGADNDSVSLSSMSSDPELREPELSSYEEGSARVRRGSEGYEVQPLDREEMVRRYIQNQVTEPGRYQVYVPEPDSESDEDSEDIPLGYQMSQKPNSSLEETVT